MFRLPSPRRHPGLHKRLSATPKRRPSSRLRPRVEWLEDRTVLSITGSFSPKDIQQAYGVNLVQFSSDGSIVQGDGAGQTIALLEDGQDPDIVQDLKGFDNAFPSLVNLNTFGSYYGPMSGSSAPWFNVVDAPDGPSKTPTDGGGEIPADIEWAHAIAPMANILDVQFSGDVNQAAQFAAEQPGVTVVSTSWTATFDEIGDYASSNVTFLSAAGDNGAYYVAGPDGQELVNPNAAPYPADLPDVLSVGGTVLTTNTNGYYQGETGWGFSPPKTTDSNVFLSGISTASSGGFSGSYSVGPGSDFYPSWTIPMSEVDGQIKATDQNQASFELSATWPGVAGGATDATYEFYDATTGVDLGGIEVNQSVSSSGVPDGNGSFQELGVLTVGGEDNQNDSAPDLKSSDTLEIVLNPALDANGNVVADTLGVARGAFVAGAGGMSQTTYQKSNHTLDFQASVNPGETNRYYPDVSLNAISYDLYDSFQGPNEPPSSDPTGEVFTGTSVGAPSWAGLVAIADQGLALNGQSPLSTSQALTGLYKLQSFDFYHETSGYNGYQTSTGYNFVTGLGSPIANQLIPALDDTITPVDAPMNYQAPEGQGPNDLSLLLYNGNFNLYDNGYLVDAAPVATTTAINIYGAGGGTTNSLDVDFGNGNPIPAGFLSFNGAAGSDNSLELLDGSFTNESYTPDGPHQGTIDLDDSTISFTNVSSIDDVSATTNFDFYDLNSGDKVNVLDGPVFDLAQTMQINSANGAFPPINIAGKANINVEDLSSGDETFVVDYPLTPIGLDQLTVTGLHSDILDLEGGSFTDETYEDNASYGYGTIIQDGHTLDFWGMSSIIDTATATNFAVDDPTSGDGVTIVNDPNGEENGDTTTQVFSMTGSFLPIDFANKTNVTVFDSSSGAGDTFILDNPTPAEGLDVLTVAAAINKMGNAYTFDVLATPKSVATDIVGGTSDDTVYVGNDHNMQDILGILNIANPPGDNNITLDDAFDDDSRTVTLSTLGSNPYFPQDTDIWGTVKGLAANIYYDFTETTSLTIDTGTGKNSWDVDDTTPDNITTSFNGNTQGSQVLNLQGAAFAGEYYLPSGNEAGAITLDSVDGGVQYTSTFGFSNLSSPIIDTVAVANFAVEAPDSGDKVGIQNGPGGKQNGDTTTQVASGSGDFDAIDFAGKTAVTVTDVSSGGGDTFTINNPAPASGLDDLMVQDAGQPGAATFDVLATPSTVDTTIAGNSSGDAVTVGDDHSVQSILGPVSVENTTTDSKITLDDSADEFARTVTLSTLSSDPYESGTSDSWGDVHLLAPADIYFDLYETGTLAIDDGTGKNTWDVDETIPNSVTTDLNGNALGLQALNLEGGPLNEETYRPTGKNSGTVDLAEYLFLSSTLNFTNVTSPIDDTATVADFTFDDDHSADHVEIEKDPNGEENGSTTTEISDVSGAFVPINFANKTDVTVADLSAQGGDTFTVSNPTPASGLAVLTVQGAVRENPSTFDVLATPSSVVTAIVAGSDSDKVTVGQDHSMQNIQGLVSLENPTGSNLVTLDDSAGKAALHVTLSTLAGSNPYDPDGADIYGIVQGMSPGEIDYEYSETGKLTLDGGVASGPNSWSVDATGATNTAISTGTGESYVLIGDGTVADINGPVDVFGGTINLYVEDGADATARTVTMSDDEIQGMGAAISWTPLSSKAGGVDYVSVTGGTGGNTFTVTGTIGATTYLLSGSGGSNLNQVNVEGTTGHLYVDCGADSQDVTIGDDGSLARIKGPVSIENTQSGTTSLDVNDGADEDVRHATLADGELTGMGCANISWSDGSSTSDASGVESVEVDAGSAANTFTVTNTGNFFYSDTLLKLGSGKTTVKVQATTGPLDIVEGSAANTVNVGGTVNKLDAIQGYIDISGGKGNILNIDDQGNSAAAIYTLGSSIGASNNDTFTSGPATIFYYDQARLTINGSTAGSTYDLDSTSAATTVKPGGGSNQFVIGSIREDFGNLGGPLTLEGSGKDILTVDDQDDPGNDTYTVSPGSIQRTNSAGLTYSGVAAVTIYGGSTADVTYKVNSTVAGTPVTIDAGAGTNAIDVTPGSRNLDQIAAGTLTVSAAVGPVVGTLLTLDDQNAGSSKTYEVTSTEVERSGAVVVDFSNVTVEVNGGNHGNLVDVESTLGGANVNAGTGTNTINIGDNNNLAGVQNLVTVGGTGTNTLNVDDQGNSGGQSCNVTATGLRFQSGTAIGYSDIAALNINGPQGGNTFVIDSTAAGTAYTINGGSGGATFDVGGASSVPTLNGIQGALTLNGQGGAYAVVFNDPDNFAAETYTLGNSTLARTGMATVTYTGETPNNSKVVVYLGRNTEGDVITVDGTAGADTFTTIWGGGDDDRFNVLATSSPLILESSAGSGNVMRVGSVSSATGDTAAHAGTLANIDRNVAFGNEAGGSFSVVIDDSGDASSHSDVTLDSTSLANLATGKFVFDNASPVAIYGGSGGNTFVVDGFPTDTDITLNGGSGSNALQGPDATNTWHITGNNAGTLDGASFSYTAVGNLVGGTGVDTFAFSPAGKEVSLNGGGAPTGMGDWLDYSAFSTPVSVNLQIGAATNVNGGAAGAVTSIQDVFGGNGGNTLIGDSQGNILVGGTGADTIDGGTGRSLLIGGGGADHVTGGSTSGGDILIGGTTSYDSGTSADKTALTAILAEWQSTDSYGTRFTKIDDGTIPGGYSLNYDTTVQGDGDAVLTGAAYAAGLDWFFQGAHDKLVHFVTGEHLNNS
jgi:hypothetical protein